MFGKKLTFYRNRKNLTLKELGKKTKIALSVLSRFENESRFPNSTQLNQLVQALNLSQIETLELQQLAKQDTQHTSEPLQFTFNPNIPIIYSDSVFLTLNQFGLILDITQPQGEVGKQSVVSRIGMSQAHGEVMARKILDLLQKNETELKKTGRGGDAVAANGRISR